MGFLASLDSATRLSGGNGPEEGLQTVVLLYYGILGDKLAWTVRNYKFEIKMF